VTSELDNDLISLCDRLTVARKRVSTALEGLTDAQLAWGRRGGWSIGRVLEHLVQSEWHYVSLMHRLRNQPQEASAPGVGQIASVAGAQLELRRAREALLAALDGVDDEVFYRIGQLGREEYSVVSLLENVAQHDQEHAAQIEQIREANATQSSSA